MVRRLALPDSESERLRERAEQLKASIRAKLGHPFTFARNVFALKKERYRKLAKNAAQLFTLFGLAKLLIAKRRLLRFTPKVRSEMVKAGEFRRTRNAGPLTGLTSRLVLESSSALPQFG